MSDFNVGDKVICIRGVEGSGDMMVHELLKTGERYTVVNANSTHIVVEGIKYYYLKDRFIKDEA